MRCTLVLNITRLAVQMITPGNPRKVDSDTFESSNQVNNIQFSQNPTLYLWWWGMHSIEIHKLNWETGLHTCLVYKAVRNVQLIKKNLQRKDMYHESFVCFGHMVQMTFSGVRGVSYTVFTYLWHGDIW